MSYIYFCMSITSIYWFTTLYPLCSYIKKPSYFFFIVLLCFQHNVFTHNISLYVSIIFISHPVCMKTRWLYHSNEISFELCLRIYLKKGYTPNQEYYPISILGFQPQTIKSFCISLLSHTLHTYGSHTLILIYCCISLIQMLPFSTT